MSSVGNRQGDEPDDNKHLQGGYIEAISGDTISGSNKHLRSLLSTLQANDEAFDKASWTRICFDLSEIWRQDTGFSIAELTLSAEAFEQIWSVQRKKLKGEEILDGPQTAEFFSLPPRYLSSMHKSTSQQSRIAAQCQKKLLSSCYTLAEIAYQVFLSQRWLECTDSETHKSTSLAMHSALKTDFLPFISALTRSGEGEEMALLIGGKSKLSKFPALRNFGSLSCGVSHPVRLFVSLSQETGRLEFLRKRLTELIVRETIQSFKSYLISPTNAHSQVLKFWKQALAKLLHAKIPVLLRESHEITKCCFTMLKLLHEARASNSSNTSMENPAEEACIFLTSFIIPAVTTLTTDGKVQRFQRDIMESLDCKDRSEECQGQFFFILKMMEESCKFADDILCSLASRLRDVLWFCSRLPDSKKAEITIFQFMAVCCQRFNTGFWELAWRHCEKALFLSASENDSRLHHTLCQIWSLLIMCGDEEFWSSHIQALSLMTQNMANAELNTSNRIELSQSVQNLCHLLSRILSAVPETSIDKQIESLIPFKGDNYSLYSSSDWLNLIILAEVLQYLRLPNKKLQIRKVLNGGADFLASKLIENLKLGEARDSHLENGIIFIVFTLRSILRLNLDVNKERLCSLTDAILSMILQPETGKQALRQEGLKIMPELLKYCDASFSHKLLAVVESCYKDFQVEILSILGSCHALSQLPQEAFHHMFKVGTGNFLLEHQTMQAFHLFLRNCPQSGLNDLVPQELRTKDGWFKLLLTQYVKGMYLQVPGKGDKKDLQLTEMLVSKTGQVSDELMLSMLKKSKEAKVNSGHNASEDIRQQMTRVHKELTSLQAMLDVQERLDLQTCPELLRLAELTRRLMGLCKTDSNFLRVQ